MVLMGFEKRIVRLEEKEIIIIMKEQIKGMVGNFFDLFID